MILDNYFNISEKKSDDGPSYEEQLLLNYEDFLETDFSNKLKLNNNYNSNSTEPQEQSDDDFQTGNNKNNREKDLAEISEDDVSEKEAETFEM